MPELPEVETIRRVLEPQLQNRTIEKVTVNHKYAPHEQVSFASRPVFQPLSILCYAQLCLRRSH